MQPLSKDLERWIFTCRLLGVRDEDIVSESDGRVTAKQLVALTEATKDSALLGAAQDLALLYRRHEWLSDLRRRMERLGPFGTTVERRRTPKVTTFVREYVAPSRPVVLTDFGKKWPARTRWTSAYLKRRCGDAVVKVVHDRERTHLYDAKAVALSQQMRFGDFIDWVDANPTSNDRYLVGNNDALADPLVNTLLKDCPYDRSYFDPKRISGRAYLWYGPGGTVTPLHHDTVNIILTQVRGTKTFKFISPAHSPLMQESVGYYSLLDLDGADRTTHPALKSATVLECTVGPGESVFIPAGWWHHVASKSVSISLTLTNFRFENTFERLNPLATTWNE
jgi:hypothetical protein